MALRTSGGRAGRLGGACGGWVGADGTAARPVSVTSTAALPVADGASLAAREDHREFILIPNRSLRDAWGTRAAAGRKRRSTKCHRRPAEQGGCAGGLTAMIRSED